jgi:hypothetical protein
MERSQPIVAPYQSAPVAFALAAAVLLALTIIPPTPKATLPEVPIVVTASQPFIYSFNAPGILYEAGSPEESSSPYWWLNSGGKMYIRDYVGKTVQGELGTLDTWRLAYARANPMDTDEGYHSQNLFRLITKPKAGNMAAQALFKIEKDNMSDSPNRNASNGLLLMSKYIDGDTLYYAGLRVDGTAVIKKKYQGTYYTMAQKKVFPGSYDRDKKVNLIPHHEWIALRSESKQNSDGSVTVKLFMRRDTEKNWTKLLEAKDDGKAFGGTPPITDAGHAGIRTDFMDVDFESFRLEAI